MSHVRHLRDLLQLRFLYSILAGILERFFRGASYYPVPDFVPIVPVRGSAELLICVNSSNSKEIFTDPSIVHSCRGEPFCDDYELLELHSEAKVDDGMQESWRGLA
jgi:hypothetical protein